MGEGAVPFSFSLYLQSFFSIHASRINVLLFSIRLEAINTKLVKVDGRVTSLNSSLVTTVASVEALRQEVANAKRDVAEELRRLGAG